MFAIPDNVHLLPAFAITAFTLCYVTYSIIAGSLSLRNRMESRYGEEKTKVRWILFQKLTGFVFLGLLPALAMLTLPVSLKQVGVSLHNLPESLLWIAGLGTVLVVVNLFAARKPDNLAMYPQIRIARWTPRILAASSLGWALYLLGYEFIFRGVLLFLCIPVMGIWPSIVLNVAFYALVHLPKGPRETIASIPMGLILCLLTLKTGTIWVAYFSHVILALSNEYLSIHFHPEMRLEVKSKGS
ncbi:MAG: CPBP family intramembrane metalloprotease [Bacteroidales bacterium]|nr:CPBP family intramembrane metalloprotease [Bacteroidales bacterium]